MSMKKSKILILASILMIYMSNISYANTYEQRTIYKVNPGESYVLEGMITERDGKRKKVTLIVKAPTRLPNTAKRQTEKPQLLYEGLSEPVLYDVNLGDELY